VIFINTNQAGDQDMTRPINSDAYRNTRVALTIADRFMATDLGENAAQTARRVRRIDTSGWQAIGAYTGLDVNKEVRDIVVALLHAEAEAEAEALAADLPGLTPEDAEWAAANA